MTPRSTPAPTAEGSAVKFLRNGVETGTPITGPHRSEHNAANTVRLSSAGLDPNSTTADARPHMNGAKDREDSGATEREPVSESAFRGVAIGAISFGIIAFALLIGAFIGLLAGLAR